MFIGVWVYCMQFRLMKPEDFAIQLGKNKNILRVQAHSYKKLHGRYPDWLVHSENRGETMINTEIYLKRLNIPIKASLYATSKLYWMLRATNHTDSQIARLMASKSKYFKSVDSWILFLARDLFMLTSFSKVIIEPTMLTEFVKHGTKYLYLLKKWNKLDLTKEREFYD
jgi:hypothetical protein